jgi:hypothetical protein
MISKKVKVIGAMVTIIIHLALLISFVMPPPKRFPPPSGRLTKYKDVEIKFIPMKEAKSSIEEKPPNDLPSIRYKTDPIICSAKDKEYLGIGVMWRPDTGLVIHVPEDYPAYKAGIRIGDQVKDPFANDITNGYLDMDVMREYTLLHFHVKVEKICFQDVDTDK